MPCIHFGGAIVTLAGPTRYITVGDKRIAFEMTYCGPAVLKQDGNPKARQPSSRNPFWYAFSAWTQQGERTDDAGECLWDWMREG